MKELINISGQKFYYSTIQQVVEKCSSKKNCAVIIDEFYLDEFLSFKEPLIGKCINQVIIISENVDDAISKLQGASVMLIAAQNFEEAIRLAILGSALSKEVICIPKEGEQPIGEIIELIVT